MSAHITHVQNFPRNIERIISWQIVLKDVLFITSFDNIPSVTSALLFDDGLNIIRNITPFTALNV